MNPQLSQSMLYACYRLETKWQKESIKTKTSCFEVNEADESRILIRCRICDEQISRNPIEARRKIPRNDRTVNLPPTQVDEGLRNALENAQQEAQMGAEFL